jgi:hypothetical protein
VVNLMNHLYRDATTGFLGRVAGLVFESLYFAGYTRNAPILNLSTSPTP